MFVPTKQSTEFEAAHFGQIPIEHEQVEGLRLDGDEGVFGAFFGGDDEIDGGEHRDDDGTNVGIIVDQEDACATSGARRP